MIFPGALVYTINFMLCMIIFALGMWHYKKEKNQLSFYIGIAFGLFGLTHLAIILELKTAFLSALIFIRILAYFILILALYDFLKIKSSEKIKSFFSNIKIQLSLIAVLVTIFFICSYLPFPQIKNVFKIISFTYLTNFLLCNIISILSYIGYRRKKSIFFMLLSISFALFALSHFIILLNPATNFLAFLIFIRICAYLVTLITLYRVVEKKISDVIIKYTSDTWVQVLIIIGAIITLIFLFYIPQTRFNSSDPRPLIYPVKPIITDERIAEIRTGIFINNFPASDIINNNFIVNAVLWFEFDPHLVSLDTIGKFSFEKGSILEKSEPETRIANDKIFARYTVRAQFQSDLDYHLFPLEDHQVNIVLTNTFLNPKNAVLVSYNTDVLINEQIFTGDWNIIDKEAEYGYAKSELDKYNQEKTSLYPTIIYSLDFQKAGLKKSLIIFIPIFIAFLLGIFSLAIDIMNRKTIISLSISSVSTLIFNLLVLQRMGPDVRYFTIADIIYIILFLMAFMILLLNIFMGKLIALKGPTKRMILLKNYTFCFCIIFIIAAVYYLIY